MENEPIKTVAGNWYSLTCTAAATVTAEIDGEPVTLATLAEGGTTVFCSPAATVTIATAGKYRVLPTKAPALNGNGGGAQPASPEVIQLEDGSSVELADGRVYFAPPTAPNLSALTVAPNATVQIWLSYFGDDVVFPDDWVWSASSEFQLPAGAAGGVGDFVVGEMYLLTVHRNTLSARDFTLAHRALTIKPAQA